ncbi:DUF1980 domain-containing protein [Bacillus sp. R1-10]
MKTATVTMTAEEKSDLITNHFLNAFKVMEEMAQEQGEEVLTVTEENFGEYMEELSTRMEAKKQAEQTKVI